MKNLNVRDELNKDSKDNNKSIMDKINDEKPGDNSADTFGNKSADFMNQSEKGTAGSFTSNNTDFMNHGKMEQKTDVLGNSIRESQNTSFNSKLMGDNKNIERDRKNEQAKDNGSNRKFPKGR